MAGLRVMISDTIGNRTHAAELPHDVPMRQLIPALLTHLNLPVIGVDGQPISYRIYHDNREIGEEENLEQASVQANSTLTLSQEAQAGREG